LKAESSNAPTTEFSLSAATRTDLATLRRFMAALYSHDEVAPDETAWAAAMGDLLDDERLGRAWMIRVDGQPAGYIVITFGYSLEFYGRDAFVDELVIDEAFQGQGIGRQALEQIETLLRSSGLRALHLEVEEDNTAARHLYESRGFRYRKQMHLMSKRFE